MKRIKILHVITSLCTGGAEKLMVDLLPRLINKGLDVELCIFKDEDTVFKKQLLANGVKIWSLGTHRNVYHPYNIWLLYRLIKSGNYNVIHTHNTAPQLFTAIISIFCNFRLITTEHNTSNRRRSMQWYKPIDKWMYNRYDKIICCSDKTQENLLNHINNISDKCLTINNGINLSVFSNAGISQDFRNQFPDNTILITMVAGFRNQKDQDTLIRAITVLDDKYHLVLVGDGERKSELQSLVENYNIPHRVHFLGLRTDIPEILKSSDYIVMSSHYEGLSLSSVEGMAVDRPMLASDVDGLKEVVGGAGILFKHGDYKQLAEEIQKLDSNKPYYNEVAERCSKRASRYDISLMTDRYTRVYDSLMYDK